MDAGGQGTVRCGQELVVEAQACGRQWRGGLGGNLGAQTVAKATGGDGEGVALHRSLWVEGGPERSGRGKRHGRSWLLSSRVQGFSTVQMDSS